MAKPVQQGAGAIEGSATPLLAHPGRSTPIPEYPTAWPISTKAGSLAVSACYLRR